MKINEAPIDLKRHRSLIYAEGVFGGGGRRTFPMRAKTADGILRYADYKILGLVDSGSAWKKAQEVLGGYVAASRHRTVPIFGTLKEGIQKTGADVLILGAAPEGGELPKEWSEDIKAALNSGLHLVSGMHYFLGNDSVFASIAARTGKIIWDVRRAPASEIPVGSAQAYHIKKPIVLTVGTDAAIGKMTVSYELWKEAMRRGVKSLFVPTGQTAVMVEGWGICIDALQADFMAGAMETMLMANKDEYDAFFVEGQGSLFHPGFSNTTISLLHGAVPTHMILVHRPARKHCIGSKLVKLPGVREAIELYEHSVLPQYRNAKVAAIALNSAGMSDDEYKAEKEKIESEVELPIGDVVRERGIAAKILERIF